MPKGRHRWTKQVVRKNVGRAPVQVPPTLPPVQVRKNLPPSFRVPIPWTPSPQAATRGSPEQLVSDERTATSVVTELENRFSSTTAANEVKSEITVVTQPASSSPMQAIRTRGELAQPQVPPQVAVTVAPSSANSQEQAVSDGLTEWEQLFRPRGAQGETNDLAPTSFEPVAEELVLPAADASMEVEEQFAQRVQGMLINGQSLSVAMGNDGKNDAMQFLSEAEMGMLEWWEKNQRLPPVNWESLRAVKRGLGWAPEPWSRHADALNSLYGVDCVDDETAKAWWAANQEWQPLVKAYGMVKRSRLQAEAFAMNSARDHIDGYAQFVQRTVREYSGNLGRDKFVFRERLKWLEKVRNEPQIVSVMSGADDAIEVSEGSPNADADSRGGGTPATWRLVTNTNDEYRSSPTNRSGR